MEESRNKEETGEKEGRDKKRGESVDIEGGRYKIKRKEQKKLGRKLKMKGEMKREGNKKKENIRGRRRRREGKSRT